MPPKPDHKGTTYSKKGSGSPKISSMYNPPKGAMQIQKPGGNKGK